MTDLGEYMGRPIDATSIAVRGIGGGLDDPLAIDPEVVPIGGHRMLCVPVVCVEHTPRVKDRKEPDEDDLTLVHIFVGDGPVFFIDPGVVIEARQEHAEKVQLAASEQERRKRAAKAQGGGGEDPEQRVLDVDAEALRTAHLQGAHADGLVDGCVECEWEHELERTEAGNEGAAADAAAAQEAAERFENEGGAG